MPADLADEVGDRSTLDLLAALVEADSLATGPSAWGPWKAGLIADLVERTGRLLAGEPAPPPTPWITDELRIRNCPLGSLAWSSASATGSIGVVAGSPTAVRTDSRPVGERSLVKPSGAKYPAWEASWSRSRVNW